jgi:hypothetical protein
MKVKKAEVCPNPEDSAEFALFVHCVDGNGDDRFLIGGVQGNRWVYQEFATPNAQNTMWAGDDLFDEDT